MKRTLVTILAAAALVMPAAAQARSVSLFGIVIQSCVVNSNGNGLTKGINVVYYNTRPVAAKEVDFLIGYQGHRYTLSDVGTFTQGATINHNLTNALNGHPWRGTQPHLCEVQRVILANGRVFQ